MKIIPILPIVEIKDKKYKNPIDKHQKKKYNAKCQKQFEDYLKECLNNERQSIL